MSLRRNDRSLGVVAAVLAGAVAFGAVPGTAVAQEADLPEANSVNGRPKGIIGGALLGGEVVMLTMGAFGVEKGWPYLVFGGLGMAGGGVAGFFVEEAAGPGDDAADTPEPAVYMLAGGMALVIPTLVVVLNAVAYKPPESDTVEPSPTPQPAAEPPATKGSVQVTSKLEGQQPTKPQPSARRYVAPSPVMPVVPHLPLSIVDVHQGELAMGMPAVQIKPLYSKRELAVYGVEQGQEVRVPVFKAQF
jgi:hypothetical protein